MYCRGGLCLIGRSRRLSFNSIAIMPSVPRWDGSPMTEKQQPECTISPMALAFFVVFDGVRIAKRGELGCSPPVLKNRVPQHIEDAKLRLPLSSQPPANSVSPTN